ncbi:PQQ-dependent sugar dehydrogenase [Pseudomonas sp. CR3202]|uniref:PQQ-dependent sugar dehydrogenase n=1 Tax=Pseudomonas sp. CR3202 TaxID=3351532 RepID=UPI003BF3566E
MKLHPLLPIAALALCTACSQQALRDIAEGIRPATKEPIGWPRDTTPQATDGARVNAFAEGLQHPRWLYVLPNGDVLVAESAAPDTPKPAGIQGWFSGLTMKSRDAQEKSVNRISLLRDINGDGVADLRSTFLKDLRSPFGMVLVGKDLYVANADSLVRFPYVKGATEISEPPTLVTDLPAGLNRHWTKNVIASRDGRKLYVTVGSNSNAGENGMAEEEGRAAIWEVDRASGAKRLFATGLRNPHGLAWEPQTGKLWAAVIERGELGSDLVPDYITSVKDGGFYGWPYSHFGQHVDERVQPQRPDLVAKALVPDYALGPHTASMGIAFAKGSKLPKFRNGLFVSQRGSWIRKPDNGYKVIFVPFRNGKPHGQPMDVLTGFLDAEGNVRGRPVDVRLDLKGALLVTDDVGNKVWRVSAAKK